MKDFPLHSRSVFSGIGVVPARKNSGFKNTIFKSILEPQKIDLIEARLLKHDVPVHGISRHAGWGWKAILLLVFSVDPPVLPRFPMPICGAQASNSCNF